MITIIAESDRFKARGKVEFSAESYASNSVWKRKNKGSKFEAILVFR